jgi:hypothetical protein
VIANKQQLRYPRPGNRWGINMDVFQIVHHARARSVIAETALALFLFFSDPFGVASYKSHYIDDISAYLTQFSYVSKASERLAVILIDQDTLDNWQVDWPITYEKNVELIHAMACAKALGVFFDMTLSKEFNLATGSELLQRAVADSSSVGPDCANGSRPTRIRVFFGKAENIDTDLGRRLDREGLTYWIDNTTADGIYPAGKVEFPDAPLSITQVTPAFGIIRSVRLLSPSSEDVTLCRNGDVRPKCWEDPLSIAWNGNVNAKQSLVSRTESCRGFVGRSVMLASLSGLTKEGRFESCPPILTLKAEDLFRDKDYIATNGNPAALIAGRFVFVGARLAGLNDQILSPVHGYIPGVYKHAMALDNLVTYGEAYPTIPRPWLLGVLVVITYGLIEAAKELSASLKKRPMVICAVVFVCVVSWGFIVFVLKWPPSLIFGVFAYYAGGVLFLEAAGSRSRQTANVDAKRRHRT